MDWRGMVETVREIADTRLFEIAGVSLTISSVLTFTVVVLGSVWLSKVVQRVVARGISRGGSLEDGTTATINRLLHYAIVFLGVATALQAVGISLTSIFAAGAFVAVGVGFALQNILQNFVSGVILLTERSITEGDVLQVENQIVLVERIGTRSTIARTRDDEEVIIPNSILVQSMVRNLTLSDSLYRVRCRVGVQFGSDITKVRQVLEGAAASVGDRSSSRPPLILLAEFTEFAVVWDVSIWTEDPWNAFLVKSALNEAVWVGLRGAEIGLAFAPFEFHLGRSSPEGADVRPGGSILQGAPSAGSVGRDGSALASSSATVPPGAG